MFGNGVSTVPVASTVTAVPNLLAPRLIGSGGSPLPPAPQRTTMQLVPGRVPSGGLVPIPVPIPGQRVPSGPGPVATPRLPGPGGAPPPMPLPGMPPESFDPSMQAPGPAPASGGGVPKWLIVGGAVAAVGAVLYFAMKGKRATPNKSKRAFNAMMEDVGNEVTPKRHRRRKKK